MSVTVGVCVTCSSNVYELAPATPRSDRQTTKNTQSLNWLCPPRDGCVEACSPTSTSRFWQRNPSFSAVQRTAPSRVVYQPHVFNVNASGNIPAYHLRRLYAV